MLAGLVLLPPLSRPLRLRPRAWPPLACEDGWNFVEAKRGLPEVPPILADADASDTAHTECMDLLRLHCVCTLHIRCARTRCHRCSSKPCSRPSAHRSSSARHKPSPWPTPPRTSNSSARRCAATRHVRRLQLCVVAAQLCAVAVPPLYRRCLRYATSRCALQHPPRPAAPPRPARAPSATPRACTHAAQREGTPVVHIADTRLNFRKAAGSVAVVARPPDSTRQLTHPLYYHLPTVPPTRPPRRACSS